MTEESTHRGELFRWVWGTAATGLLYLVRRVPIYRRDRGHHGWEPPDQTRSLPGDPRTVQRIVDGVGPLFHRRYWIDVTDTEETAESLLELVANDLNEFVPGGISEVTTLDGSHPLPLDVGDELVVRIAGPWNGPVRVIERTPSHFRFATLVGHLEAGEIEFRAYTEERGFLRFEIESWARSGDALFDLLYNRVPFAREAQLYMWAVFCRQVAKRSGGIVMSSVQAETDHQEQA
jgi:hypothetical protein